MSSGQFVNKVPETRIAPIPTKVTAIGEGDTRFFMADNPETLTASTFAAGNLQVLAHDTSAGEGGLVKYRIFIWSLNNTGKAVRLGITVGNASPDTYQIRNFKWEGIDTSGDYLMQVGLPLAKSLIANTLDMDTTPTDASVPSGKVKLINEVTIANGKLCGVVCEFEIYNPTGADLKYKVRVVGSTSTTVDLRSTQAAPVTLNGTHPRGAWVQADARTSEITYVLGSGDANYSFANGDTTNGDHIYTAENSNDPTNSVGNAGQFGVKRLVDVHLINETDTAQTARIYVNARGGAFCGAAKVDGGVYGIPTITPSGNNVCPIAQYTLPAQTEKIMQVELTVGGGSSTAFAILLTTKVLG